MFQCETPSHWQLTPDYAGQLLSQQVAGAGEDVTTEAER